MDDSTNGRPLTGGGKTTFELVDNLSADINWPLS